MASTFCTTMAPKILLICLMVDFFNIGGDAWKEMHQYEYSVIAKTETGLLQQYSGNILKANLIIQRQPMLQNNLVVLTAKLNGLKFAEMETDLSASWDENIREKALNWHNMEITKKPFMIMIRNGKITNLVVNRIVPNWEANFYKAVMSQFQINTNGTNLIRSSINQLPNCSNSGSFRVMEDTITGQVNTLYEIHPLPDTAVQNEPWIAPLQDISTEELIEVFKTKNYSDYKELPSYHYGFSSVGRFEPSTNKMGEFFSRSSTSRIIISGTLKDHTVQSSITTNKIIINPIFNSKSTATITAVMNVTILKNPIEVEAIMQVVNPVNIGNLVYTYDKPFEPNNLVHESTKPLNSEEDISSTEESMLIHTVNLNGPRNKRDASLDNTILDNISTVSSSSSKSTSSSETDSSSSSSYSVPSLSSEEDLFHEEVSLDLPPQTPLLPLFTGFQGRNIKTLRKFDLQKVMKNFISEIIQSYENPETIIEKGALSKYSALVSVFRVLNYNEVEQLIDIFYSTEMHGKKANSWKLFLNILSESGTGPALMHIKKLIISKRITGLAASTAIASLTASVHEPTYQYMYQLYSLINNQVVMEDQHLFSVAHIGYANLIRKVYINKHSSHTHFPTHVYGSFRTKQSEIFTEKIYIPYLINNLHMSIQREEKEKALVYIRAMGNIGSQRILGGFEPYLEGTKNCSQFERIQMVAALDKLCEVKPKTARSILVKILQNPGEIEEVRIMALYLIMKTNPPAGLLQRLAEYTNDVNTHKNLKSAIISAIKSAAQLLNPEQQNLRSNARTAIPLLNKEELGMQFSQYYLNDFITDNYNTIYQTNFATLGTKESLFPKGINLDIKGIFSGANLEIFNFITMLSSVSNFDYYLRRLNPEFEKFVQNQKSNNKGIFNRTWSSESITKMLNIQADILSESFEGNILYNLGKNHYMYTITNNSISNLKTEFQHWIAGKQKNLQNDFTQTINLQELILSIPTETSWPGLFSINIPTVLNLNMNISCRQQQNDVQLSLNLFVASNFQSKLSFVFPYNNTIYTSGVSKNIQMYFPINLTGIHSRNGFKLVIDQKNKIIPIFRSISEPYTAKSDISLLCDDCNKNVVLRGNKLRTNGNVHPVQLTCDTDNLTRNQNILKSLFKENEIYYHNCSLNYNPLPGSENVILNFNYLNSYSKKAKSNNFETSLKHLSEIPTSNYEQRLEKLMELSGYKSKTFAADLIIEFPSDHCKYIADFTISTCKIRQKTQFLIYFKSLKAKIKQYDLGMFGEAHFPNVNDMNFEIEQLRHLKANMSVNLFFGNNYIQNNYTKLTVNWFKSLDHINYLKNLEKTRICQDALKKEDGPVQHCMEFFQKNALFLDSISAFVQYKVLHKSVADVCFYLYKNFFVTSPYIKERSVDSDGKNMNGIYMDLRFNNDMDFIDLRTTYGKTIADFEKMPIEPWKRDALAVHIPVPLYQRILSNILKYSSFRPYCFIGNRTVITFDAKSYSAHLPLKQFYPILLYLPKLPVHSNNKNFIEIQNEQEEQFSLLLKRSSSSTKDILISIRNLHTKHRLLEWEIKATNFVGHPSGEKPTAYVYQNYDGEYKMLLFSNVSSASFGDGYIEAYVYMDGAIKVTIDNSVQVTYNGASVKVELLSNKFYGATRGLCGTFDGEPYNDFLTPSNCIAKNSAIFLESYSLLQRSHNSHPRKGRFDCVYENQIFLDVISNRDSGRNADSIPVESCSNFDGVTPEDQSCTREKYIIDVMNTTHTICYSTRKIPFCSDGCTPLKYVKKLIPFWCTERNEYTDEVNMVVAKDAKMSFRAITPTKRVNMTIPFGCHKRDKITFPINTKK